ncbi:MAG: polysaccharide biosynthesis tyrosine autokinase [Fibrobacteres bacterium]|nr:polysaccharide biosynthesis tyrosine autokinase [Fibrobacterota bacterium]
MDLDNQTTITLQDVPYILRRRWWLIGALSLLGALIGAFKGIKAVQLYKADVMVQVGESNNRNGSEVAEISRLTEAFSLTNATEGEIEIAKSRLVLSEVVRKRGLNLAVEPPKRSIVDRLLRKPEPYVDLVYFGLPDSLLGTAFEIELISDSGAYVVRKKDTSENPQAKNPVLLQVRSEEVVDSSSNSYGIHVLVRGFYFCEVGSVFTVVHQDELAAIQSLATGLSVEEIGKKTGLISLSYESTSSKQAAEIANDIAEAYVSQNVDRRTREVVERYAYIQQQLPSLKKASEDAQNKLRQYRSSVGSVDLSREVEQALSQQADIGRQLLDLSQKKKEALEKYRTDHPVVRYIDSSIVALRNQEARLQNKVKSLPFQQQEIMDMLHDVEVTTQRYTKVQNEAQQIQAVADQKVSDVRIVDRAVRGSFVPKRGTFSLALMGLILGGLAATSLAVGHRMLYSFVESPAYLESVFQQPVLAILSHSDLQSKLNARLKKGIKGIHLLSVEAPEDLPMEALRSSVSPVKMSIRRSMNNLTMIVGASPGSGKSFVAANLAVQIAQTGAKVLLIDADLRKGNLQNLFSIRQENGLSEVLTGSATVESVIVDTRIPDLFLLPTGGFTNRSTVLLQSVHFDRLLESVSKSYDIVILDAPPVLALSDATVIASHVGTILLVFKHASHTTAEIEACRKGLDLVNATVTGIILNDVDPNAPINGQPLSKQTYKYSKATT